MRRQRRSAIHGSTGTVIVVKSVVCFVVADDGRSAATAALRAAGFVAGATRATERSLLDTADRRLERQALVFEASRHSDEDGPVTITVTGADAVPATAELASTPRFLDDLPSGLRDRLQTISPRALLPFLTVRADISTGELRDDEGKIVARATIVEAPRDGAERLIAPMLVELRVLTGYGAAAKPIHRALAGLASTEHHGTAMSYIAQRADVVTSVAHPRQVPLDPASTSSEGFRTVLAELAETIRANRSGAVEQLDTEFLHDLRIAVRRTRTVLAHARSALPPDVLDHARVEFAWLGSVTGPARDLDVALVEWDADVSTLGEVARVDLLPLRTSLAQLREDAHRELSDQLTSPRFDALLDDWTAWLNGPEPVGQLPDSAGRPLGILVGRRVQRAFARVIEHGRLIDASSPAEQLHALRKDSKKLRYLFDCFGGVMNTAALRPVSRPLKGLLRTLGEHQDSEVRTAQLAHLQASSALPAGPALVGLVALLDSRRQEARDEFEHRFRALDRRSVHRALHEAMERIRR